MWLIHMELCMKLTSKQIKIIQLRLDFEIGIYEAIREIFLYAKLMEY